MSREISTNRHDQKPEAGSDMTATDQHGVDVVALHNRNVELEEGSVQSEKEIAEFRSEAARLRNDLKAAKLRLEILEDVLAPRLLTLLSLKPFRFILAERNRRKNEALAQISTENAVGSVGIGSSNEPQSTPDSISSREKKPSIYDDYELQKPLGVAVFAYDRADHLAPILESLSWQGCIPDTTVFIDGDQGRPHKRAIIDNVEKIARQFGVTRIKRNRGNFGFRKMIIIAMREMMDDYERILFLEDDCFPTGAAIKGFSKELDAIEDDPAVFSVYGHPFGLEQKGEDFGRFQGWGWATTSKKLRPIWEQLLNCYLMSEAEYLEFVKSVLTSELRAKIDVTPGRQPTSTLERFFAWDETVCLLTAAAGMAHRPSAERIIYNFGAGDGATHFGNTAWYRRAPFNIIGRDEIWGHF